MHQPQPSGEHSNLLQLRICNTNLEASAPRANHGTYHRSLSLTKVDCLTFPRPRIDPRHSLHWDTLTGAVMPVPAAKLF